MKAARSFRMLGTSEPVRRPNVPKEVNPQQNRSMNLRLFQKSIEHTCRYAHSFITMNAGGCTNIHGLMNKSYIADKPTH